MQTQKTPLPSVSAIAAPAPLLSSKEQSRLKFEAEKKARLAARTEKEKLAADTETKVIAATAKYEQSVIDRVKELAPIAAALKGADTLQAVLIRRELAKHVAKKREIIKLTNLKQKTDRADVKATNEASRSRTPLEQERYDAAQLRKAAKEAAAQTALLDDAQRIIDGQYFAVPA